VIDLAEKTASLDSDRIAALMVLFFAILGIPLLIFVILFLGYGSFARFFRFMEDGARIDMMFSIGLGGTCLALILALRALVKWIRK